MPLSLILAGGLAASMGGALPAPGAAEWWTAGSPRAEVVTDAGPVAAESLAARLHRFHDLLEAAFPLTGDPGPRPVVMAFASRAGLSLYVPLLWGRPQPLDGVFQGGDPPYLAITTAARNVAATAAHEYVHVRLAPALAAQPPWVGEGLAEVLSAWALREDGSAVAGLAIPEHLALLREEGSLPLRSVIEAGYASPAYQEPALRPRLYATAWALVHMVFVGRPDGRARLDSYLDAIAAGASPEAAFAAAFGIGVDEVERRLPGYLASPLPFLSEDAPAPPAVAIAAARPLAEPVSLRHRAELAMRAGQLGRAQAHLERALQLDPADVDAREALAEAFRRLGRHEEAARQLDGATFGGGGPPPRLLLRRAQQILAEASRRDGAATEAEEDRAVALLEAALRMDPALADAADLVARLRPQPVGRRIAHLAPAVARQPHRTELALTLASLHVRRNDHAAAARVLVRARDLARDDAQRFLAAHMLGKLDAVRAEAAVATGRLVRVGCGGQGDLRLDVRTPGRTLRLHAPSASAIFVYDPDGRTLERDLVCGAHDQPATVSYRPHAAPGGTDGTLLWLSFTAGS